MLLTPSYGNPLGYGCRYYFNRKQDNWGNEFDKIPFTPIEELTSKFIAEYTTHKNSRYKKQISREEFEYLWLNPLIMTI